MRKAIWMLACVALAGCRSPGSGHDETRARVASIIELLGSVQVLRGGNADWSATERGAELFDEDRLRTFKGARAMLAFPNGSSLRVEEEALISLGELGGGITVERGTVEGELSPGLTLRTPSLEAEVAPRDIVIQ